MKIIRHLLSNAYRVAAQDLKASVENTKESINQLKQKMDEDPQVRTAVIHCATYVACLIIPAAFGVYLSVKNDGTPNVWRAPDGSEKIEMVEPN